MTLAYLPGGTGAYTINNGTLSVTAEYEGFLGDGTFNQNFGTHSVGSLVLGSNGNGTNAAATGAFNLANGTLTVSSLEQIGLDGTGAFVQNGGTHALSSTNAGVFPSLSLGVNAKGIGAYTLNLGALSVAGDEN